jgi:hypothetical protein
VTAVGRARAAIAALSLAALATGCDGVATQTDLRFDAEALTRGRARTIYVSVVDGDGVERLGLERLLRGDSAIALPTIVPIVPLDRDSTRIFTFHAELRDVAGTPFAIQRGRLGFVRGARVVVDVVFQDVCVERLCDPESTCRDGSCVDFDIDVTMPGAPIRSDLQIGVCLDDGGLCWEQPRPLDAFITTACIAGDLELVAGTGMPILARRDGVWTPEPSAGSPRIGDLACWDAGRAIAVGRDGTILERAADGAWASAAAVGVTATLTAVSGAGPEDAWIVGAAGTVLRRTGAGWETLDAGTTETLIDVWSPRRDEAYVIGTARTMRHHLGGAWESMTPPGTGELSGLAGRDGELLAIARGGAAGNAVVHARTAAEWTPVLDVGDGVVAVALTPSGRASAAGGRGVERVRESGDEWRVVSSGRGINLWSTAVAEDRALFVGRSFISRAQPGARREETVGGSETALRAIAAARGDPATMLAVGDVGLVIRRVAPSIWRREVVPDGEIAFRSALHDVSADEGGFVVVGDGGLVARRSTTGGWTTTRVSASAIRAVASRGGRAIAVGDAAVIVEEVAGSWTPFAEPFVDGSDLLAVAIDAAGAVVVATRDGRVLRHDGAWSVLGELGAPPWRLRAAGDALYACADALHRWTGSAFERVSITAGVSEVRDVLLDDEGAVDVVVTEDGPLAWSDTEVAYVRIRSAWPIGGRGVARAEDGLLFAGDRGSVLRLLR